MDFIDEMASGSEKVSKLASEWIEILPDAALVLDHQYRVANFNSAAVAIFGTLDTGLLYRTLPELFLVDTDEAIEWLSGLAATENRASSRDLLLRNPVGSGRLHNVFIRKLGFFDKQSDSAAIECTFVQIKGLGDIYSNVDLDDTFIQSKIPLCIISETGNFLHLNPAFTAFLGWSQSDLADSSIKDLCDPESRHQLLDSLSNLGVASGADRLEMRFRTRDGNWLWMEFNPVLRRDNLIHCTLYDTARFHRSLEKTRKLTEERDRRIAEHRALLFVMNEREEEIRAIVENLTDCVITINVEGRICSANQALTTVLGYSPDEVLGKNVSMLMPESVARQHDGYLEHYQRTGEAHIIGVGREVEGVHKEGYRVALDLAVSAYTLHEQQYFVGTLRDLRDKNRLISELKSAKVDAEQANRAKSAFLATMSHEIRTPMNGVLGMLEILARSELSEQQADAVHTMRNSSLTLLDLIDDILDFSKIEANELELDVLPIYLSDLIEDLCASLVSVAIKNDVTQHLYIAPDVPEQVWCDDTRIRQILFNLIGNAIKFSGSMTDRKGRVSVRIENSPQYPDSLQFSVSDNGIGMEAGFLEKLFDVFTQGEISTTRRYGGTGLGLGICKRLVELMSGIIEVESTPGVGTSFKVTLPVNSSQELPARPLPVVSDVECVVVEGDSFISADLSDYLKSAITRVRVLSLGDTLEQITSTDSLQIVLIDATTLQQLDSGYISYLVKSHSVKLVVLKRSFESVNNISDSNIVLLSTDILRRFHLLNAVAVAAGDASTDIIQKTADDITITQEDTKVSITEARSQGRLILVAEDDEINQKVILRQLAILGYAAEVAPDGSKALEMWRDQHYALVLTDLHMPEMDGYQLTEMIRKEEKSSRRIPVIALTANALRGEEKRAHITGMDAYLTKPIQLDVLADELMKWLPKSGYENSFSELDTFTDTDKKSDTRVIDVDILKSLVGDDDQVAKSFMVEYLEVAYRQSGEILMAYHQDNLKKVLEVAHKLKSSSRAVGALAFGDVCAELETAIRSASKDDIKAGVKQFESSYSEVVSSANDWLNTV
ncbi:PAS domain S-box protein [Marinobacterium jannaschii]|uniref:PAS domain S-box protein n=1 Tax=Marinobacterium jannaschii TaxID=64970 RepID=UPI000687F383|nr:PAS domain S-box protein [Marinobacterium jannaschii]